MNPSEFSTLTESEQSLWWFRGMKRMLFAVLDPLALQFRIGKVLEAGSGTGYMARQLRERYGWTMFPVELAWEGVSNTRSQSGVWPVQADIAACPFPAGCFDAVVSLDVLVHFPAGGEAAAIREFARVLRPGGLLLLRVSALDVLKSRHSVFTHERQRFTRRRLELAVAEQGFEIRRLTYANALLLPVALARFRVWEPLTNAPPASGTAGPLPRWLDRLLYLHLAVETRWIAWGFGFPAGQSLLLVAQKQ